LTVLTSLSVVLSLAILSSSSGGTVVVVVISSLNAASAGVVCGTSTVLTLTVLSSLSSLSSLSVVLALTVLTVLSSLSVVLALTVVVSSGASIVVSSSAGIVGASVSVASVSVASVSVASVSVASVSVASIASGVTTVAAVVANRETDTVILSTTLSHRHQHRLVVGSSRHGAETVVAGGQTTGNSGSKQAVAVASVVDTLKEDEALRVKGLGRGLAVAHALDGNVSVADNVTVSINVLRSRVVGVGGVCEATRGKVDHLHLDVERLVGGNVVTILGVYEKRRNHVVDARNVTHGDTIARARLDLSTVGESLALTEVDEVGIVTMHWLATI
jgi:hypothetical protein